MHNSVIPDLRRIRKEARLRRKSDGRASYMQYLDLVARELYGVRHFHEAQRVSQSARTNSYRTNPHRKNSASPLQHYLRSLQEYYLDF